MILSHKMGDMKFGCPLCCNEFFNTKDELVAHLTNKFENLHCPVCEHACSSMDNLMEHLSLDNCQSNKSDHLALEGLKIVKRVANDSSKIMIEVDGHSTQTSNQNIEVVENSDVNKIYVDLLDKQIMKPSFIQDLKLVQTDGSNQYMITLSNEDTDFTDGSTIVTKQNKDGTISFTAIADMKLESEPEELGAKSKDTDKDKNIEETLEEIYSCNTCGVSFTSVLDHIQNYHSDQEVVVAEPIEQLEEPIDNTAQVEYNTLVEDSADRQGSRRVITDTGDIVETPMIAKTEQNEATEKSSHEIGREKTENDGETINAMDSDIPVASNIDEQKGPYHKVIVKEVETDRGTTVKLLHCLVCKIIVSSLSEFKSYPCKILRYTCPQCTACYDNPKSLSAHMKVHKTKPDPSAELAITYVCSVCCTRFPTNKSLKLHKRMHDPVKARPIELPVCTPDDDSETASREEYQCDICDKMIPVSYKTIHLNSHQTNDEMNCTICNKKFTSLEYLEMHMGVHNTDKVPINNQNKSLPYKCLYCERRFARPHEKVKHERIHTGEKPHSCEICGKSFRVSYCLTLHMRTHTGARPYACPHCPKRFKAHSVFNHHLLTHSEVRGYKCPFCPKAFKTAVQLAGHKNSHTKPFSCQHCNRPFASLYAVRIHTETHARQNNLKFSCSLCGASYARAFALKDHVKQVHNHDVDTESLNQEEWMVKEKTDEAKVTTIESTKELSEEMTEMEMSPNVLETSVEDENTEQSTEQLNLW